MLEFLSLPAVGVSHVVFAVLKMERSGLLLRPALCYLCLPGVPRCPMNELEQSELFWAPYGHGPPGLEREMELERLVHALLAYRQHVDPSAPLCECPLCEKVKGHITVNNTCLRGHRGVVGGDARLRSGSNLGHHFPISLPLPFLSCHR